MIGLKIKELRLEKKISQKELAKKAGLAQGHISEIETNQIIPSLKTLKKISNALEYNITKLIEDL